MKRRTFLTGAGIAVTSALSGCADNSTTPDPKIESVSDSGTELVANIKNPEYADRVEFDVENEGVTEASISEDSPTASYTLGDPQTLGTKDQRLHHESEIQVAVYKQDGSQTDSTDWVFEPKLELTGVSPCSEFNYKPETHAQATTPVFEITNTGNGPTRIGELVVLDIRQEVPLKDSNNRTGFAKAVLARNPKDDRLHPVKTREDHQFLIAGGKSAYFAANGLFTHSGEEPESIASVTQEFDVEIRWLFGDLRYTVDANLTGGISQTEDGTYRFSEYEVTNIDDASPLR
jgi:hypothetical protein